MGSKSDEEFDLSDSEIDEYKEATYKLIKFRAFKIRAPDGEFRCPFCDDAKVYQYTPLLQHAVQVAESKGRAKLRANHSAVAKYLVIELADEAEPVPPPPESSQPFESRDDSEDFLGESLIFKERESNEKLQEARNAVIEGFKDMPSNGRAIIGVKIMGELDLKVFLKVCKNRFPAWQVSLRAAELCSSFQEKLRNPLWHPFRVVECKGYTQRKVNEDDGQLKAIKKQWGGEVYDAVVTALEELNKYNASGCYPVPEIWNFKENCEATLGEAIWYVFAQLKTLKRKRV